MTQMMFSLALSSKLLLSTPGRNLIIIQNLESCLLFIYLFSIEIFYILAQKFKKRKRKRRRLIECVYLPYNETRGNIVLRRQVIVIICFMRKFSRDCLKFKNSLVLYCTFDIANRDVIGIELVFFFNPRKHVFSYFISLWYPVAV